MDKSILFMYPKMDSFILTWNSDIRHTENHLHHFNSVRCKKASQNRVIWVKYPHTRCDGTKRNKSSLDSVSRNVFSSLCKWNCISSKYKSLAYKSVRVHPMPCKFVNFYVCKSPSQSEQTSNFFLLIWLARRFTHVEMYEFTRHRVYP